MVLFYNILGLVLAAFAVMMLRLSFTFDDDQRPLRSTTRLLSVVYALVSLSMFTAQLEDHLPQSTFEVMNPLMLLFFYLIAQGLLLSILTMYGPAYISRRYIFRSVMPVLVFSLIYTACTILVGHHRIYSAGEFMALLPHDPILVLRCLLALAMLISVGGNLYRCHQVRSAYAAFVLTTSSRADYTKSVKLSRLVWNLQWLATWVLITYFYTTPLLEVVSCLLIAAMFAVLLFEFRRLLRPADDNYAPVVATVMGTLERDAADTVGMAGDPDAEVRKRWETWIMREDKPFTQSGITIAEVAKELGITKNRLSAYINSRQTTFRSWVNTMRVEEAKQLLDGRPGMSVSEIADHIGFCDLPAFSHAFKKSTGVSPREYREA